MKKIISLFQRNYDGDRLVRDEVVSGAEWVTSGEGVPTQKLDGTPCLMRNRRLYKRYDVKRGKQPPPLAEPCEPSADPHTGHWPHWVPVDDGPEDRWFRVGLQNTPTVEDGWTYELLGPHVQGNPEYQTIEVLVRHGSTVLADCPRTFVELRNWFSGKDIEGVVWWRDINNPNCDKVKIKKRDFGLSRGQ